MPDPQLIVYDFDGTLVDTRQDIANAVNLALGELGLRTLPPETIFNYVGKGVQHLMTRALEGTGLTDLDRAVGAFMRHYEEHLMDHTRFFPHGRETLRALIHKKQAILSNKPRRFIVKILENLDCADVFADVIGGDTLKCKKPDPAGLLRLMQTHGLKTDQLLMVGDSLVDLETARRAGVPACAVTWGHAPRAVLEDANPDWIIDSLDELPTLMG